MPDSVQKRYIYCNELGFELSELYETAFVADKYMVHHMMDELINRVRKQLNEITCCLIYDQLIKIQTDTTSLLLSETREFIKANSETAFKSWLFPLIDQDALIGLLNFEQLSISEIDLLQACSRWVELTIMESGLALFSERQQSLFKPIKQLIRWSDLKPWDVAKFTRSTVF